MTSVETRLVTIAAVVAAAGLGAVATLGTLEAAAAGVVALGLCVLAVLGQHRFGLVALGGSFMTAPMYRGIGSIGPATPTDLLLLLGLLMLLPVVFRRRIDLPGGFVVAVTVLGVVGLASSANNGSPILAVVYLLQWLVVFAGLPAFLVMWAPPRRVIDGLLGCYVFGQLASIGKALVTGPALDGRYQGFSHHPNDFGLASGAAVAILLYLLPHYRKMWVRVALLGLVAINLYGIVISGSRGVTLAIAVVIVLIPVAERSGLWALLLAAVGAGGLAVLPFVINIGGSGGALQRLQGDKGTAGSDSQRSAALSDGWHRFLHSPFIGSGLDPLVGTYHNLFLEVAVAFGIFGFAAYLVVCFIFARPIVSNHPLHRLAYLPWLFLVVGITFPGIVDRTVAVPMALALLATVPWRPVGSDEVEPEAVVAR